MAHQWSWKLLRAGSFRLDGGGMFGVVPKALWARLAPPDDQNRIPLQTNCLLLDDGSRRVLVESGFGAKWSQKERGFYELQHRTVVDALRETGVEPSQVDAVIVTHLHFDHAAGLTVADSAGRLEPTFPNATLIVQRTEWDDALANKSTMNRTYLRSHLDPLADAGGVRAVEGEIEALPGITVHPAPGHTWGLQAVMFHDDRTAICFPGDVLPTANHVGLAFSMGYDMLPHQNMLTKRALLTRAEAEGWRLVLGHEAGDPIVGVGRDPQREGAFTLKPVAKVP